MELSHSLTLNEEAFKQVPDHMKPVFVFEWLRFLDKVLIAAQKVARETAINKCVTVIRYFSKYFSKSFFSVRYQRLPKEIGRTIDGQHTGIARTADTKIDCQLLGDTVLGR